MQLFIFLVLVTGKISVDYSTFSPSFFVIFLYFLRLKEEMFKTRIIQKKIKYWSFFLLSSNNTYVQHISLISSLFWNFIIVYSSSEVSEIQQTASDLSKKFLQKNFLTEDIQNMHEEMKTFKLEMNAMKSRQDKSEVLLRELREEVTQSSEDYRKSFLKQHSQKVR